MCAELLSALSSRQRVMQSPSILQQATLDSDASPAPAILSLIEKLTERTRSEGEEMLNFPWCSIPMFAICTVVGGSNRNLRA